VRVGENPRALVAHGLDRLLNDAPGRGRRRRQSGSRLRRRRRRLSATGDRRKRTPPPPGRPRNRPLPQERRQSRVVGRSCAFHSTVHQAVAKSNSALYDETPLSESVTTLENYSMKSSRVSLVAVVLVMFAVSFLPSGASSVKAQQAGTKARILMVTTSKTF